MSRSKILLLAVMASAFIAYFALGLGDYLNLDYLHAQQSSLQQRVRADPVTSSALFFLVYVGTTAASFPGAAILTLAAGALFGVGWGTLIVSFASSLGATLAFLAARYLLRDVVADRFGTLHQRIDGGIEREGGFYLFGLRLVPLFPFFAINLAMGLTSMRIWPFYWISQLGMLPGTLVYVNAGTQLARIDSISAIASPALLLSFAALGLFPLLARRALEIIRQRRVLAAYPKPAAFDANLVVIGAGSGGLVAAYLGAALKARTVLIERDRMGGDCLNTGCVPSKTLLRSAKIASYLRRAPEFGLGAVETQVNFPEVMARVRGAIARIAPHDSIERYTALGVECIQGEARLLSPYVVEVDGRQIAARNIILATGAKPRIPDIPGLADAPYVTSDSVWNLEALPARLLVVGGGPVGCELAQAFARLGSRVTLATRNPRLLPKEDDDVAELVAQRLQAEGIELRTGFSPLRIEPRDSDWCLTGRRSDGEITLGFDTLLVAAGRCADVSGLGLDRLPVALKSDGSVAVDEFLRTTIPTIYAVGDLTGDFQYTHTASHQAYYAVVNALFGRFRKSRVDDRVIPWTTFTDPEVAHVGLNEQQARQRRIAFEVTRYDLGELDRAIAEQEAHGFVKVLTVPGRDRILGATIVGHHAGELIAEFVLAMRHGLGLNKLLGTIHVYPTLTEANKAVAGNWRRAHTSTRVLDWLARYLARQLRA